MKNKVSLLVIFGVISVLFGLGVFAHVKWNEAFVKGQVAGKDIKVRIVNNWKKGF